MVTVTVSPIGDAPGATAAPSGRRRRGATVPRTTEPTFKLTDYGNAERLVHLHGRDLLHLRGSWYVWDGRRYRMDETGAIERRAKRTVRTIWSDAKTAAAAQQGPDAKGLAKHAIDSESRFRLSAMISLAASEAAVVVDEADDLDADPWLLNCSNGTINLRTGDLLPHDRAHRITRCTGTPVDFDMPTPRWDAFLARILPDPAICEYVQRIIGYTLTARMNEEKLFIFYGDGANGKSTLMEAVMSATGEYAIPSPPDLLISKKAGAPSNDVASLRASRLVSAIETQEGGRLNEVRVKALVSGDRQSARFLHKEFFSFKPVAKYIIATNHRPIIHGADNGIWRRMVLVPFTASIREEEKDREFMDKLREELPGILAWAVRGCLAWQRDGLLPPPVIQTATAGYRAEQDLIGGFLADQCVQHPNAKTGATPLYMAYREWCETAGENFQSQRAFGQRLSERGGLWRDDSGPRKTKMWHGIGLRMSGEWDYLLDVPSPPTAELPPPAPPVAELPPAAPAPAELPPVPAPTSAPETSATATNGPCPTCAAPGPSCGVGGVAETPEPCVACQALTLVRARCGTPRHAACRTPGDDLPADPGPTPPPAATPTPERRPTHPVVAARTAACRETLADQKAALAEGRELRLLRALENAFEPRRRIGDGRDARMVRPFWRPELPGCTYAVHAVEAWGWNSATTYTGPVVMLDRNASFISAASSVLVAHGSLEHTGPLDTFDKKPGYYQIDVHPWYETATMPNPLMHVGKRKTVWVTAPTAGLLADLVAQQRWPDLTILDSYTAEGVRLDKWAEFLNALRKEAITVYGRESEQYDNVKDAYSQAFQLMLGRVGDNGHREWICGAQRPDWTQTVRAQAAVTLWRAADDCRRLAPDHAPVALRNTDELVIPAPALDVVTTRSLEHPRPRINGISLAPIDPTGLHLGTYKIKELGEWKGGK